MMTDTGSKPDCALCHSKEHEHVRRGESCAERLVGQRDMAQTLAWVGAGAVGGMLLAYASVILLFLR